MLFVLFSQPKNRSASALFGGEMTAEEMLEASAPTTPDELRRLRNEQARKTGGRDL